MMLPSLAIMWKRHPVIGDARTGRSGELAGSLAGYLFHEGEFEEARHGAVEDAEAVAARTHFEIRLVQPVDRHLVAQKAVLVQDVASQLAGPGSQALSATTRLTS